MEFAISTNFPPLLRSKHILDLPLHACEGFDFLLGQVDPALQLIPVLQHHDLLDGLFDERDSTALLVEGGLVFVEAAEPVDLVSNLGWFVGLLPSGTDEAGDGAILNPIARAWFS